MVKGISSEKVDDRRYVQVDRNDASHAILPANDLHDALDCSPDILDVPPIYRPPQSAALQPNWELDLLLCEGQPRGDVHARACLKEVGDAVINGLRKQK